jgi:hypothetical protein
VQTRMIAGLLLIAHGALHLFGFLTAWDLIEIDAVSRTPTVLTDDIPDGVVRDMGALWLLGAIAFAISGYALIQAYTWWKGLAFGSAVLSLIATLFWIHDTWPGLFLNLLIIILIARTWGQPRSDEDRAESHTA